YADAAAGHRQTVFVTGPAGIGKTALVEAFTAALPGAWLGRGQCVDVCGADEAYLPVLDALAELSARPAALALRQAVAPAWAVHVGGELPDAVALRAAGATPTRMLREGLQLLEALAEQAPVVLVLEDLHWADEATASGSSPPTWT